MTEKKWPEFKTEEEEAEYWASHSTAETWESAEPVEVKLSPRNRRAISIRLDEADIDKLQQIARTKGIGYSTLLRMWVKERLSSERMI